jgi:opacity protein-like surface antigen
MKWTLMMALGAAMLASPALADPWKDESGKGRWGGGGDRGYYGRSYNEAREYKQGNCKIERKWERDGGYKEETKCKGYR